MLLGLLAWWCTPARARCEATKTPPPPAAAAAAADTACSVPSVPGNVNFIATAAETALAAVVVVEHSASYGRMGTRAQGSGFLIDPSGIILTNMHVVHPEQQQYNNLPVITLHDGRTFRATIETYDRSSDLAVLRIQGNHAPFPYLKMGNSSTLRVGEWVIAVGAPSGLQSTVTAGIVSNVSRHSANIANRSYIQTDASITSGNSGGPLVNVHGEAVGICSFKVLGDGQIGFAIPIDFAKSAIEQWHNHGRVLRPYLGLRLRHLNSPEVIHECRRILPRFPTNVLGGVAVVDVMPGPARDAGFQIGDVIVSVNGEPISGTAEIFNQAHSVGVELLFHVKRGEGELDIRVAPSGVPSEDDFGFPLEGKARRNHHYRPTPGSSFW